MKIALINFGYNRRTGVETLADNMMRQIDRVDKENEYILIVRKGSKREFKEEKEKQIRRESAMFWEERNIVYSDIWFDIKGTLQAINDRETRSRSAAYPFEIAYFLAAFRPIDLCGPLIGANIEVVNFFQHLCQFFIVRFKTLVPEVIITF